jgi:hypothetical protein
LQSNAELELFLRFLAPTWATWPALFVSRIKAARRPQFASKIAAAGRRVRCNEAGQGRGSGVGYRGERAPFSVDRFRHVILNRRAMAAKSSAPELALPDLPCENYLGAKQLAAEFGVDQDTVLRWWHEGLPGGLGDVPDRYMRRRGFRDHLFHPQVIEFIRAEQSKLC